MNAPHAARRWSRQRSQPAIQQTFNLIGDSLAVLVDHVRTPTQSPRFRVGIGTATDRHHGDGAGMVGFDRLLRRPSPIAVNAIELPAIGRAVAGIVHQNRSQRAVRIGDSQQGQRVIDRTLWVRAHADPLAVLDLPPIDGKRDGSLCPGHLRRLPCRQSPQRDLLQSLCELAAVSINCQLMFGRDRATKDVRYQPAQTGTGMSVRGTDGEPRTVNASAGQPLD